MTRKLTDAQINDLAADLVGTCSPLHDALARMELTEDDLSRADHEALDEQVFECDVCGWWCGAEQMGDSSDGQVCTDCEEQPDEED